MKEVEIPVEDWLDDLIHVALAEDVGSGDVTTESIIDEEKQAKAVWVAKESGVVAGLNEARYVFQWFDEDLDWNPQFEDGDQVQKGETIVEFSGNCRAIGPYQCVPIL